MFVAASVDGVIARRDGAIDWLDALNARVPSGEVPVVVLSTTLAASPRDPPRRRTGRERRVS